MGEKKDEGIPFISGIVDLSVNSTAGIAKSLEAVFRVAGGGTIEVINATASFIKRLQNRPSYEVREKAIANPGKEVTTLLGIPVTIVLFLISYYAGFFEPLSRFKITYDPLDAPRPPATAPTPTTRKKPTAVPAPPATATRIRQVETACTKYDPLSEGKEAAAGRIVFPPGAEVLPGIMTDPNKGSVCKGFLKP